MQETLISCDLHLLFLSIYGIIITSKTNGKWCVSLSNQLNGTDKNNETTTQLVAMLQEQMNINQAQILANQKQLQVNEALTQEVKLLREQIAYLTNKLYGKSKESLPESLSGQLSLDLFGESVVPPAIQEEEISVQPHKRKKRNKGKKVE